MSYTIKTTDGVPLYEGRSFQKSTANIREAVQQAVREGVNLKGADLKGADLESDDLKYLYLKSADLSYSDLKSADLSYSDLRDANLRGSDLSGADLGFANLKGADLSEANLPYARLTGADLTGANLKWADLSGADLGFANLSGADLEGADLRYARLPRTNLTGASLINVRHTGNLKFALGADLEGAAAKDGRTENAAMTLLPDMVDHPPHYTRGPLIKVFAQGKWEPASRMLECIEVVRWISDYRLATAMKYVWRVAFGGKHDNHEDIRKAVWYLNDWLENKTK